MQDLVGHPVEVLNRTPSLPCFRQFYAAELPQHPDVVSDLADVEPELLGDLLGAGDPFCDQAQRSCTQGVHIRLGEALLIDRRWALLGQLSKASDGSLLQPAYGSN